VGVVVAGQFDLREVIDESLLTSISGLNLLDFGFQSLLYGFQVSIL